MKHVTLENAVMLVLGIVAATFYRLWWDYRHQVVLPFDSNTCISAGYCFQDGHLGWNDYCPVPCVSDAWLYPQHAWHRDSNKYPFKPMKPPKAGRAWVRFDDLHMEGE